MANEKKSSNTSETHTSENELSVKQIVFSALLESLNEIIGPDGKESIVRFAGLEKRYANKYLRPSLVKSLPKSDLLKFSNAMNRLLGYGSKAILKEMGRKFAIYLAPYGYTLNTLVGKLKKWIDGDWDIEITDINSDKIQITIINDPFQSKGDANYLWTGFFEMAATNSSQEGSQYKTDEKSCSGGLEEPTSFIIEKKM